MKHLHNKYPKAFKKFKPLLHKLGTLEGILRGNSWRLLCLCPRVARRQWRATPTG